MTSRAQTLLSRAEAQNKHAVDLAMVASPAVRIEPAVLRSLRLEFLPASDPSAEADLWMSPLVGVRSASAITLVPEVASLLRQRLSEADADGGRFRRIADRIDELHAGLSPLLRLEERVIRMCYESGSPVDAIDAEMAPYLRTIEGQPDKVGVLASWAVRAIPRLPEPARRSRALWALALAGSAKFGVQPLLEGDPPEDAVRLLPGLLPSDVASTSVEIRRYGGTLELYWPDPSKRASVSTRGEAMVLLDVPATSPVIVEVRDGTSSPIPIARFPVALSPGQRKHVSVMSETVRLRTLRGEIFNLTFRPWAERAARAEPIAEQAQTAGPRPDLEDVTQTADLLEEPNESDPSAESPAEVVIEGAEIFQQAASPPPPVEQQTEARGLDSTSERKSPERYRIYISHSPADESFAHELRRHLASQVRSGLITINAPPAPGEDRIQAAHESMQRADIILLLLSADYLADDETYDEGQIALRRDASRLATVFAVRVRFVDWESTPFTHLPMLPRAGDPISALADRDRAWSEVAQEIRRVVSVGRTPH